MIDDAEPWDVVTTTTPTARKQHRCGECYRTIQPGEKYERTEGRFDGRWTTNLICLHCLVLANWLSELCRGFIYGAVAEDVREHLLDGIGGVDVARAATWQRMRWTSRRTGELVPVPDTLTVPQRARWAA